ncbi:MAG: hypothetical protein ACLTAA_06750 [Faecalibacterium prausnitzii]
MRLRKNMKRTAAAVLALSMAVSAVAAPASAAYICNVSQGSVEVSVDSEGNKTIKVGDDSVTIKTDGTKETTGNGIKEDGDGTEDIVITGDNTKPTESLNAEEENTSEAEKSGENTSEVEKSGETEGEGKTQNSAVEGEDKGDEPTSQELLAPEDEQKETEQKETEQKETDQKKDEQKPAETQETEQDKKTEKTSDQVIEYGQYDPEAQQEATKLEAKPAAEQKAEEKKAAEEKTYGDTNAPTSLSESVQTAANNVVKIINKSKETLKVILRDLKVDAGNTNKSAVTVSGTGNVTLELDGKNELTGGSGYTGGRKAAGVVVASDDAKLTIQGKEGSSLSATGGAGTGESDNYDGYGIRAGKLDLMDATVTATGGVETEKDSNIKNSKLIANGGIGTNGKFTVGEGGEVIAIGKDVKTTDGKAQGGNALGFWGIGSGYEVQKGGKLTAIGGNAESESGDATGGNALWGEYGGIVSAGETTLIGGNAKSGSGKATGGDAIKGSCDYFTQVTVKEGTFTAAGGKSESATSTAANGNSVNITPVIGNDSKTQLEVQEGGTFVTAKPGNSDENGNGITGKIEIKTEGGKIEEVENAKVVKKEDGSITVTGDLVGIKKDDHNYKLEATVEPTCTTPGKRVYTCTTHEGETYEETIDALGHEFVNGVCTRCGAPESNGNGGSSAVTLTVTGAGAYETSIADGRYVVAVPAEAAVLSGCLSNLKELKAQGVNTLVFRTQLRETALNIDSMLSLGVDGTLFTLTHSGESAELTVGGVAHNELLH